MNNPYDKHAKYSNHWQTSSYGANHSNDTVSKHIRIDWSPVVFTLLGIATFAFILFSYVQ